MENRPGAHPFGVFLESILPISLGEEFVVAKVVEQLSDVFPVDDLSETHVPGVHCRHHYQDVVRTDSQQIESFKFSRNQTVGNFFNYSNAMPL